MSRSLAFVFSLLIAVSNNNLFAETAVFEQAQITPITNVRVAARDPGIVQKLLIEHGDEVVVNQELAVLDEALFRSEYDAASKESEIAAVQARNDVDYRFARKSAELNYKTLERSHNARSRFQGSVSRTEIERLELELEKSNLSAEQAEMDQSVRQLTAQLRCSQEKTAKVKLANRSIRSPLEGQVVDVFVQQGEWVNAGEPIARVLNLKKLRVKAVYNAKYAGRINRDSKVVFESSSNEKVTPAKIFFVSPEINPATQDFEVWAEIDNMDRELFPGLRGALKVEIPGLEKSL